MRFFALTLFSLIICVATQTISITPPKYGQSIGVTFSSPTLNDVDFFQCEWSKAASCLDIAKLGVTTSGEYFIDADAEGSGQPFKAYCDLTSEGGGWTMCYTSDGTSHVYISSQVSSSTAFGTNGYRSDCRNIPFGEIMYLNHANNQRAYFRQVSSNNYVTSVIGFSASSSTLGNYVSFGSSVAATTTQYQLNVCSDLWMTVGYMITGDPSCYKACGSWCSDLSSVYFRTDGDFSSTSYRGVSFNENGHRNVANKLMSVGLRPANSVIPSIANQRRLDTAFARNSTYLTCAAPPAQSNSQYYGLRILRNGVPILANPVPAFFQVFTCSSVLHYSSSVCSGRGTCIAQDTCECQSGYTGANCQVTIAPFMSNVAYFSGSTHWNVNNGANMNLVSPNSFAYEFWVNFDSTTQLGVMMGKEGGFVWLHGASGVRMEFHDEVRYAGNAQDGGNLFMPVINRWYHMVSNFRRVGTNIWNVELIVDGVSRIITNNINSVGPSTSPARLQFMIGDWVLGGRKFIGYMSDVKVWLRSFTAADIAARLCSNTANNAANLVAYWTMDGVTTDATGNNYFLTGANQPTFVARSSVPISNGGMRNVCGSCPVGYSGADCTSYMCFGILSTDPAVCSGHGTCTAPNVCSCSSEFSGQRCNLVNCPNCGFGTCIGSVYLDGSTFARAASGALFSFPGTQQYSFAFWVYPMQDGMIFSKYNGGVAAEYYISVNGGEFYGQREVPPYNYQIQGSILYSWNHYVIVYNSSHIQVYVNGVFSYSSFRRPVGADTSTPMHIGTILSNSNRYNFFRGYINQLQFYNIALNSAAVMNLYTSPISHSEPGLRGSYDFIGTTGANIPDQSSNGANLMNNGLVYTNIPVTASNQQCRCNNSIGLRCQTPLCFGTISTSSAVCSGNGTCTAPNTCICNPGFTGDRCHIATCNNIDTNALVFDGTTSVTVPANPNYDVSSALTLEAFVRTPPTQLVSRAILRKNGCGGSPYFIQIYNSIFMCAINDQSSMYANGVPLQPNTYYHLACTHSSSGSRTRLYVNGKLSYSMNLASSISTTTGPLHIGGDPCGAGGTGRYIGHIEEIRLWNVELSEAVINANSRVSLTGSEPNLVGLWRFSDLGNTITDSSNIRNHGTASGNIVYSKYLPTRACAGGTCFNNICTCPSGFGGSFCNVTSCYGIAATDANVCSGRGICNTFNNCTCANTWSGLQCQFTSCAGLNSSSPSVCSGRGTCASFDNCQCSSGFSGFTCNFPICHGVNSSSASVCSGHGACLAPNDCTCSAGWSGLTCQFASCFGINNTNSNVCSAHGICSTPNLCTCNTDWTGAFCQIPVCFNVNGTSASVCSGHGTCNSPNVCSCSNDWTGAFCQLPTCYGVNSTSASVCSGHGTCSAPNTCSCSPGWTGAFCQLPMCFAINSTSSSVCSGHGSCNSPNLCTCSVDYTGAFCQIPICYSINGSSASVCSGHGVCSSPNSCTCNSGYTGLVCSLPICYGVNSTNPSVCSGHGTCNAPNQCNCLPRWSGMQCDIPSCYGINATNSGVCSGHGSCNFADSCSCLPNWTGIQCNLAICHGINSSLPSVCSGHGTCNLPNNCTCQLGYTSTECNTPICYNKLATDPTVCQTRGSCVLANTCACSTGYLGSECQISMCYDRMSNESVVCSGHGTCEAYNKCVCSGNWIGNNCNLPLCFGSAQNVSTVCSGHGSCISPDNCFCVSNYSGPLCQYHLCYGINMTNPSVCSGHGTCNSLNTCACLSNWVGARCEIPLCHGISANSSNVCSNHGTCSFVNQCNCSSGYTGSQCELAICSGKTNLDPSVCEGKGVCTSPNVCACPLGYTGSNCHIPICFGRLSNESSVCSGKGNCLRPNNCSCVTGYTGNNCQFPICFNNDATNANVCSQHGICITPNNCSCVGGYFGSDCSLYNCFTVLFSNTSVCTGHGSCMSPNGCACSFGWTGSACSLTSCFGISQQEDSVCSAHGVCTSYDTCSCYPNWTGINCNIPICFGVNASLATVCSGHGACVSNNSCSCQNGWNGHSCSSSSCFGFNNTDPNVCSGHGACVSHNQCTCTSGYSGSTCNMPICYGKISNDPTSCNGKGRCVAPDTCLCNYGYASNACQDYACNGVSFQNPRVCSGNGTCSNIDNCICNAGFSGFNCQFFTCNGLASNDPLVCARRGRCIGANNCTCETLYEGRFCERTKVSEPLCNGLVASDARVCSGNGNCTGLDTCTCKEGYTGALCQHSVCFGISSQQSSVVCNGRGVCTTPNTCICNSGFTGQQCESFTCFANGISNNTCVNGFCAAANLCLCRPGFSGTRCELPICFGIPSNSPQVCNGRGSCIAPSTCRCSNGSIGLDCRDYQCFGKLSSDPSVCNGNGRCIGNNICDCRSGFVGNRCEPNCFGMPSSSSVVCSGEGICTAPDTCICTNPRKTGSCDSCLPGFTGVNCQNSNCNPAVTCNNRGDCLPSGNCSCYEDEIRGFWSRPYCTNCARGYVGPLCNIPCSPSNCSGHGTCHLVTGACNCFDDAINGRYEGSQCDRCKNGWFGSNCLSHFAPNLTVSDSLDRLIGFFILEDTTVRGQISCSIIFGNQTALLGHNPRCWWPNVNSPVFEIIFGEQSAILPQSVTSISLAILGGSSFVTNILPPVAPARPEIFVRYNSKLGTSENALLDASATSNGGRRPMNFTWSAVSGYRIAPLNNYLANLTSSRIVIPNSLFEPDFDYVINVTARNYIGVASTPFSIHLTKMGSSVPVVNIEGPSTQYVSRSARNFVLSGYISSDSNLADINTKWRQLTGPSLVFRQVGSDLIIEQFAESAESYSVVFAFSATRISNLLSTEVSVQLVVEISNLVAKIEGGNQRSVSRLEPFSLDGSSSFDPENYNSSSLFAWSCSNEFGSPCYLDLQSVRLDLPLVTIPANVLPQGNYIFTLTFSKDSRTSVASTRITVNEELMPIVTLQSLASFIVRNTSRLSVIGQVLWKNETVLPSTADFKWTMVHEYSLRDQTLLVSRGTINEQSFVFNPMLLIEGQTYVISLNATIRNTQLTGFSSQRITIVSSPTVGLLSISPTQGLALETDFEISCEQYNTDFPPLEYSFAYIDSRGNSIPLSFYSQSNFLKTKLPTGAQNMNNSLTIVAFTRNMLGAIASQQRTVVVSEPSTTSILAFVANQTAKIAENTPSSQREVSSLLATSGALLEVINMGSSNEEIDPCGQQTCNCSNFGTCINGVCQCVPGRKGRNCQLAESDYVERQQIRSTLLSNIASSLVLQLNSRIEDPSAIQQLVSVCEKFANGFEEFSPENIGLIIKIMEQLIYNATLNENAATVLFRSLSHIVSTTAKDSTAKTLISKVSSLIDRLLSQVARIALVGDKASQLALSSFVLVTKKAFRDTLGNSELNACESSQSPKISLPSSFNKLDRRQSDQESLRLFGTTITPEVNIHFTVFNQNPYMWSASSTNISSGVIRFDVLSSDAKKLKLKNMIDPVYITIPFRNTSTKASRPVCKYWDEDLNAWHTYGCWLQNVSNGMANCACNHTTDFAVFMEEVQDVPISYVPLLQRIFQPMFLAPIASGAMMTLYIIASILVCFADCASPPKDAKTKKKSKNIFAHLVNRFALSNLWITLYKPSVFALYKVSRFQILSVIFFSLSAIMAANMYIPAQLACSASIYSELLCNKTVQEYRWIVSGIAIAIVVAPISRFFILLLSLTKSQPTSDKYKPNNIEMNTIPQLLPQASISQITFEQFGMTPQSSQTNLLQYNRTPRFIQPDKPSSAPSSPVPLLRTPKKKLFKNSPWKQFMKKGDDCMNSIYKCYKTLPGVLRLILGLFVVFGILLASAAFGALFGFCLQFWIPQVSSVSVETSAAVFFILTLLHIEFIYFYLKYIHVREISHCNFINLAISTGVFFVASGCGIVLNLNVLPSTTIWIPVQVIAWGLVVMSIFAFLGSAFVIMKHKSNTRSYRIAIPQIVSKIITIGTILLACGAHAAVIVLGLSFDSNMAYQWLGSSLVAIFVDIVCLNVLFFGYLTVFLPTTKKMCKLFLNPTKKIASLSNQKNDLSNPLY